MYQKDDCDPERTKNWKKRGGVDAPGAACSLRRRSHTTGKRCGILSSEWFASSKHVAKREHAG